MNVQSNSNSTIRSKRCIITLIIILILLLLLLLMLIKNKSSGNVHNNLERSNSQVSCSTEGDKSTVASVNEAEVVHYGYDMYPITVSKDAQNVEFINAIENDGKYNIVFEVYNEENECVYSSDGYVEPGNMVYWNAYDNKEVGEYTVTLIQRPYNMDGNELLSSKQVLKIIVADEQ